MLAGCDLGGSLANDVPVSAHSLPFRDSVKGELVTVGYGRVDRQTVVDGHSRGDIHKCNANFVAVAKPQELSALSGHILPFPCVVLPVINERHIIDEALQQLI